MIVMFKMLITWVMFGDMVAEALSPQAVTGGGGRDAGRGYLREENDNEMSIPFGRRIMIRIFLSLVRRMSMSIGRRTFG